MDGGASGGGGGPAPFLLKTYEMVDDSSTDAIVSWSGSTKSFVVWNPPEFARVLLPSYFKHNNFSSFIRQLNTYGFRKIDPERWEFANDEFVKDQKHLLKNIHRRKPIHSHSQPQGPVDPERATYEEEIDKLSREKAALEGDLVGFKEEQSVAKGQLEDLTKRIGSMEQRQENLLSYLNKSVQNPQFVERLAQKLESMDFSAYNKKRRLPQADGVQSIQETVTVENQSSCRPELDCTEQDQEFCNKLRLELSTTVSDINLLSHSTQSSNEDGISPQGRIEEWPRDVHMRTADFICPPETQELSDTGASSDLLMDSALPCPKPHSLHHSLTSNDEGDDHLSCLLNLSLASSTVELNKSHNSTAMPQSISDMCASSRPNSDIMDAAYRTSTADRVRLDVARALPSSPDADKQAPAVVQKQVNDVFWEQFLTERPGCSDTEEASSCFRANPYDEQEEKKPVTGVARNTEGIEHLTL
ncbi:heat stress transcription factor A-5-like [Salvia divinorum]|uniref:Heat stress transcription factor n=1 Tax=Salvia divinorum TaxID=28513 RepID=A0ABD1HYM7_SALDI